VTICKGKKIARLKSGIGPSQPNTAAQYDASMPCNSASKTDVTPTTTEEKMKRPWAYRGVSIIEPRLFARLMLIRARPAACVTMDNAISDMLQIRSSLQPTVASAGNIEASRVVTNR
jgi:hypothetical protein